MKARLVQLLTCPLDGGPLELRQWESSTNALSIDDERRISRLGLDRQEFIREITAGVLVNPRRKVFYPIYGGVPRMLVFPTAVAQRFVKEYASRLAAELPGYHLPDAGPMPGEETVLRTFSAEWVNYEWKGDAYWSVPPQVLYDNMKYLLKLKDKPVRGQLVLEVGIGIGGIADYMASQQQCELVGIDLSYAVDSAYGIFGRKNPFLHIVQASAFRLPFREASFDLAYSQGVLHHTHDTRAAVERVAKMPKRGGRFYIWVYSPTSEKRTRLRRVFMSIENAARPVVWRLPNWLQTLALIPVVPLYVLHQNYYVARRHSAWAKYGWSAALHAARDRLTPRFVHRHSEDEVCEWFRNAGYTSLQRTSQRKRPDFIPESLVLATSVEGVRQHANQAVTDDASVA